MLLEFIHITISAPVCGQICNVFRQLGDIMTLRKCPDLWLAIFSLNVFRFYFQSVNVATKKTGTNLSFADFFSQICKLTSSHIKLPLVSAPFSAPKTISDFKAWYKIPHLLSATSPLCPTSVPAPSFFFFYLFFFFYSTLSLDSLIGP